ncbi:MAG: HAMP domain-containing histidine kinase [Solirubrobacterales bacterium]|nr:HAMP domain-containing histidine kinase [Solirubrobacterales bacterium]MBV9421397.1 HAMP domain-containing histidine kinase [Solirubrobacterales bacterium]MBV9796875.1 HAMP domain-containing histidine kinase [Solirubrobacterales bacterium]
MTRIRSWAGSLSRQFALAVAIVVAPVLLALIGFGLLMVVSGHDVTVVAAIVLGAGVIAVVAAKLLAAGILKDVHAVRDGLTAVGRGERDVVIETRARDELGELAEAGNAMIARLRAEEAMRDQSDAARRNLVAAVSHDLRTPITSLRLLAEAVGDDIVDEQTRRGYLARIRTHIDALSSLIDDLFELSRLEAGDIRWTLERVPLGELVGETVAAMRVQAEVKGVAVSAEVPEALRPARANPEKLQRVLFNLIQNAIRHTPADGSVVVRAAPVADAIEVEVADTGDGIAPEERDRVFTAFYRGGADAARTSAGAGLGLAVSRAIVEAHGGRIWLADAARGTTVRFSLPVAG